MTDAEFGLGTHVDEANWSFILNNIVKFLIMDVSQKVGSKFERREYLPWLSLYALSGLVLTLKRPSRAYSRHKMLRSPFPR